MRKHVGYPQGKWPRPTKEEAFWERANKRPGNACWLWSGQLNGDGYGILRRSSAHRFAYELLVGKIPDGLQVDHTCSVRNCVNPTHMDLVTHEENVRRSHARGMHDHKNNALAVYQRSKTHCKNGHEFTPENTRIDPSTHNTRRCRTCEREKTRRYLAKLKGKT